MPLYHRKNRKNENNPLLLSSFNEENKKNYLQKLIGRRQKKELFSRLSFFIRKIQSRTHFSYELIMVALGFFILFIHMVRVDISVIRGDIMEDILVSGGGIVRTNTRERPIFNDDIALKISCLDHKYKLGEVSSFQESPKPKIASPNKHYGGIKLNFLAEMVSDEGNTSWERKVNVNQDELMGGHVYRESDFEEGWKYFDNYYAFDDDFVRNSVLKDEENHCRRVSWHRLYNPNCNIIHETEVVPLEPSLNRLLG